MFKRIDKQEAMMLLENEKSVLIDIRDNESFNEGHLEKALHITQNNLPSFIEKTSKDAPILVMCYHGNSSQNVAKYLTTQGFENVSSIDGGYEGWVDN